jgi:hypothetical protein
VGCEPGERRVYHDAPDGEQDLKLPARQRFRQQREQHRGVAFGIGRGLNRFGHDAPFRLSTFERHAPRLRLIDASRASTSPGSASERATSSASRASNCALSTSWRKRETPDLLLFFFKSSCSAKVFTHIQATWRVRVLKKETRTRAGLQHILPHDLYIATDLPKQGSSPSNVEKTNVGRRKAEVTAEQLSLPPSAFRLHPSKCCGRIAI